MSNVGPDADEREPAAANSTDSPAETLNYAEAALRCGQSVTQIETALMAKGLARDEAATVVNRALESQIGNEWRSLRRTSRRRRLNRGASLALAAAILGMAIVSAASNRRPGTVIWSAAFLVVPLAFIWFSEPIGRYESSYGYRRPTPGVFVAMFGWLMLLVLFGALAFALISGQDWFAGVRPLREW